MALKEFMTTKDLQAALKVSRQAIYKWRQEGLPYRTIGTSVRFDPDEVSKWIDEQEKSRK